MDDFTKKIEMSEPKDKIQWLIHRANLYYELQETEKSIGDYEQAKTISDDPNYKRAIDDILHKLKKSESYKPR